MTGADLEARIANAVRKVRSEGYQPTAVTLHPEDSRLLATAVHPRQGPLIGCGLAVNVDGCLVSVYASSAVEQGVPHVGAMEMDRGIA